MKQLRRKMREFEDRKISSADLAREIYSVARELMGEGESELRRSLERLGNRIMVLSEQGLAHQVHGEVLEIVDQVGEVLVDSGY